MKFHISRQTLYLLIISLVLLIFVLLFAFLLLVPKGKEYRIERLEMKKYKVEKMQYQQFHDETFEKLKKLQSDNKRVITAYENMFDAERFVKLNKEHFESLKLKPLARVADEDDFVVYEVNTTSKIDSPQSFYNFLDAVNKSEWIVGVNFPIHFERDDKYIRSSFTMKVFNVAK